MADLLLREFDVLDRLRRDHGDERLDLARAEAKAWRRPFVKTFRQFAHCLIAAPGDIGNNGLDRAADLSVGLFLLAGQRRRFYVLRHQFLLPSCPAAIDEQARASDE
jgi:hypothetical protein